MDIKELQQTIAECTILINTILDCDAIGSITKVSYNGRIKRSLGRAKRFGDRFELEFNKGFFTHEDTTLDQKMNVIYHELVHTINGCFNHGNTFNRICTHIEIKTGLDDIAGRRTTNVAKSYFESTYKYEIKCNDCSTISHRNRTLDTNRYRCKCGGSLTQTQLR